jgi:hypothetical protein
VQEHFPCPVQEERQRRQWLLGKPTFFPWKMTAGADLSDVPGLAKQKKTKKTGKRFVYKKKNYQ